MVCCSIKLSTTLLFFSSSTLHSFLHHSWHPSATPLPLWIIMLVLSLLLNPLFISFHSVHGECDQTEPEHERPCRPKYVFLKSIILYMTMSRQHEITRKSSKIVRVGLRHISCTCTDRAYRNLYSVTLHKPKFISWNGTWAVRQGWCFQCHFRDRHRNPSSHWQGVSYNLHSHQSW